MGESEIESKSLGGEVRVSVVGGAAQHGGSEIESKSLVGEVRVSIVGGAAQHSGGSEIESNEPVRKKPKLHEDEDEDDDEDEDASDDHESMSEDDDAGHESDRIFYESLDRSTHIPVLLQLRERDYSNGTKSDAAVERIRMKIADLKSTGFKGISFTALRFSDAFEFLNIFSDPGGLEVRYEDIEWCTDEKECMFYITLLKKLVDCGIVSAEKYLLHHGSLCFELLGHPSLSDEEQRRSSKVLSDYFEIYNYNELVERCQSLRKCLLKFKSKEKYLRNPECFKERLRKAYLFIGDYQFNSVFEAVVKWWMADPEKDEGESARTLMDNMCEQALWLRRDRLRGPWTKADYVKLKLDVAGILGICEVPDEIASFVLPGHYRWSSSKEVFEQVSYQRSEEFEDLAEIAGEDLEV